MLKLVCNVTHDNFSIHIITHWIYIGTQWHYMNHMGAKFCCFEQVAWVTHARMHTREIKKCTKVICLPPIWMFQCRLTQLLKYIHKGAGECRWKITTYYYSILNLKNLSNRVITHACCKNILNKINASANNCKFLWESMLTGILYLDLDLNGNIRHKRISNNSPWRWVCISFSYWENM